MSEIQAIRLDAAGVGTFEKTELETGLEPVSDAEWKSMEKSSSTSCCDKVQMSRPMKRYARKKATVFKKQVFQPQNEMQKELSKNTENGTVPQAGSSFNIIG